MGWSEGCLEVEGEGGEFGFRGDEVFFCEFAELGVGGAVGEEGVELGEGAGCGFELGEGGGDGLELADAFGELAVEGVGGFGA